MSTMCAYPATAAGFSSVNPSHSASASASQVHSLSFAGEMPGFEFPGGRISQWPCDINCARGLHQTCPRNTNNTSTSSTTGKYNNLGSNNGGALTTVLGSNNSQFPVPPISVETLFFKNNNSNNLNLYGFPTNNSHHNNSKAPPSYALNVVAAKLDQQQQQVNPKKRSAAHLVEKNRTGNVRWPVWPESGLSSNSLPPTPALVPTPNNQSQLHAEHHHPQQQHHQQQQQCLLCCHNRPKNGPAVNSSMASHQSFSSATAVNQQQDALFRRPLQERDPNCPRLGSELLLADEAMGSNGPTNSANANVSKTGLPKAASVAVGGSGVTKESSVPSLPSSPAAASWALLTSYYPPLSNRLNASHSNSRPLALDPKKDYSVGLSVDCSVEYDLPRVVRPPPGAQPLLILAPRPSIPLPATPTLLRPPPLYPTSSAASTSHSTSRARQSLDYRSGGSNASQPQTQQQQQWTRNAAAKVKQQQLNVASQTQRLLQQGFPVGVTAPASNLVPLQEGNGRCGCPACLQQQQQRLSTTLQAARKLEANNGSGAVASTTSSASTSSSVVNSHYMSMPPAAFHPSALNGKPNWSHWSPPVGSSPGKGLSSAIPPATAATNFYHHQQQMLKQQQEWSSAALPALVKMSELSQQQSKAAECSQQNASNRRSSRKRSAAVLKNEPAAMACWPPNSVMTSGGASSEAKLARLEAHLSSAWYPVNNPTLWPMKVYQ